MTSTSDATATKKGPDTSATKNGPGTISDALTAFEAQATKLSAGPTPDPNVAVAYALGWAVGDALTCAKYRVFGHLVKVPELDDPADQWKLLVRQIISRCGKLNNHLDNANAHPDLSEELKASTNLFLDPPSDDVKMDPPSGDVKMDPPSGDVKMDPPSGDVNTAVADKLATVTKLHTDILAVLWSVESSLAKSYQLGHEMEQMCTAPIAEPSTTVSTSVRKHDAEVHRLLIALASKLPANAAHATDNSLRLWSASLQAGGEESAEDLLQQGRRWHEVLAGDVSGKDGLRLTDYVAAADSVAGKLWQTARQVAARFAGLLIVAVFAALVGIGLIIWGAWGARGAIGAGIATVLATFGLTWKGIGEFFGRVAAKGEEQLWDAEIDWAIAYRFTILKNPPDASKLKARSKALNIDQPTQEHLQRYTQWKDNWPDILTS
jgi:hypothetical protein